VIIGNIKKCGNCGKEIYIRLGSETCPECNVNINYQKPNKAPEVIVFLGVKELNRRAVVEMRNNNMIDDF
jgi:hypothetical protein